MREARATRMLAAGLVAILTTLSVGRSSAHPPGWTAPDTLLSDTTVLWRATYQPLDNGDFVLAVASDDRWLNPDPERSRLVLIARSGQTLSRYEITSPDPANRFICHAEPFQLPRVIVNPDDRSVHVLFGVRGDLMATQMRAVYEIILWTGTLLGVQKVISPNYPPSNSFAGELRLSGFGATSAGSQPLVWWTRNDGVWARTLSRDWNRPFLVVGDDREDVEASSAYVVPLAEKTLFAFRGYARRDIRPNVDPRGYANALYFGNTAVRRETPSSKPKLSAEFQLLWRRPQDYVGAPYLAVDTTRHLVHVFATVYRQAHPMPDAILYEALLLDDTTVVVQPRFLVDFSDQRAYLALSAPVLDSEGGLHLAYYVVSFDSTAASGVWYLSGCGENWAEPVKIAGPTAVPGDTSAVGYPELAISDEDTLYLVYMHGRKLPNGKLRSSVLLRKTYALKEPLLGVQSRERRGVPVDFRCFASPNPCRDKMVLRITAYGSGMVQVKILDVLGRQVWEHAERLAASPRGSWVSVKVPVASWPAGTYLYRIVYEAGQQGALRVATGKFVHLRN